MTPDSSRGDECFVGISFAEDELKARADDPLSFIPKFGYVIFYIGYPVMWVSKIQS